MAVTVGANNNRIEDAETTTGWGNDGGGGGIATEPDFVYQGSFAASRKISTSRIGRSFTDGAGHDFTATDRGHAILKINITNYAALLARTAPAAGIKVGSGSGAHYEYEVFGNDNYPIAGGWQFIAIDPSVSGYRDVSTGSPSLTGILYFSLLADFSATSKSENVVIDAIDNGAGLYMTGGTPDGTYDDFVTHDEGTSGNRYGYVHTKEGVIYVLGGLSVGRSESTPSSPTTTATQFTDSGKTIVWLNSYASTGFFRHRIDLGNASTTFDVTNVTYISTGLKDNDLGFPVSYTTTEDTRLLFEFIGTAGSATLTNCQVQNAATITLTSAVTIDGGSYEVEDLTQGSANIANAIIKTTSIANAATLTDPVFGTTTDLHDTEFEQAGAGHALEIDTAGSYDLENILFTGYNASDGQSDSAIYVSAGTGTVTLNINGGTNPSVRTAGATVVKVINPVTLTLTASDTATAGVVQNARAYIRAADGTGDLHYQDSITITRSGSTATATLTAHVFAANEWVLIEGADQDEYNGLHQITAVATNTFDYTVSGTPTTPATGTITATHVLINALTNVSGQASFTKSISLDQPVTGWVRKGTSSPLYKQTPVTVTWDKDTGNEVPVPLVSDEG